MTFFDKNIDLRVDKISREKLEQLIRDDCYDNGKIYIVEDQYIDAENLRIVNVSEGINERDAINVKQLDERSAEIEEKIAQLRKEFENHVKGQLSAMVRYCTINLLDFDKMVDSVRVICSYTMLIDVETVDFLNKYDIDKLVDLEDVLKYLLDFYNIEYTSFTIDNIFEYVEKISKKIGFKILK